MRNATSFESTSWKLPSTASTATSTIGYPASGPLLIASSAPFSNAASTNSFGTFPPTIVFSNSEALPRLVG